MSSAAATVAARVERLRARLSRGAPGSAVQWSMAPGHRPPPEQAAARAATGRPCAALVLLYPWADEVATVLTVRAAGLREHAGQVSFPGGSIEPGESAQEAAVREAEEELAVPREALEVVGVLSPLWIPPSNFTVQPIVAAAMERPSFVPAPDEVAHVLDVPLERLARPETRCVEEWLVSGAPSTIPHFRLGEHVVWGATAMILAELLVAWREAQDGPEATRRS